MIELNGSYGEGGGQIIRTALVLSAITGKSFRLYNIRANRPNPGLSYQHLKCIDAVSQLTDAKVEGDELRSNKINFNPKITPSGHIDIDIGTAGSTMLLIQSIMPMIPSAKKPIKVKVIGGTDVKWSPPFDYIKNVKLPILEKMGYKDNIKLIRRGYYPEGGGKIIFKGKPTSLNKLKLEEFGHIEKIGGVSHSGGLPKHVVKRQTKSLKRSLKSSDEIDASSVDIKIKNESEFNTAGKGSGIVVWAKGSKGSIKGGSALGEPGKAAERVGKEAAKNLINEVQKKGAVDRFCGDQLIPFIYLKKDSKYTVTEITSHTKTNIKIANDFLDDESEIKIEKNNSGCFSIHHKK